MTFEMPMVAETGPAGPWDKALLWQFMAMQSKRAARPPYIMGTILKDPVYIQ